MRWIRAPLKYGFPAPVPRGTEQPSAREESRYEISDCPIARAWACARHGWLASAGRKGYRRRDARSRHEDKDAHDVVRSGLSAAILLGRQERVRGIRYRRRP